MATATVNTTNNFLRTNFLFDFKDCSYVKTLPGFIKCIVLVLNILGFICMMTTKYADTCRGTLFSTVSMVGFWFTGVLLCFYLCHVIEKLYRIPWLKFEYIFCVILSIFYLIASILAADHSDVDGAFGAASVFGFCAMIGYGFDAYLKFIAIEEIFQRSQTVSEGTSTTNNNASAGTATTNNNASAGTATTDNSA